MEASSTAFDGAEIEAPDGDPFGEDGQGDFQQQDPFGEEEAPATAEEPPIVNREGEPVAEAPAEVPAEAPAEAEAPAAEQEAAAEPDPTPHEDGDQTALAVEDGPSAPAAEAEAPADKKKKDDGRRPYVLIVPEGRGKYAELSWREKGGKVVPEGTAGSQKQTVVLASDNEEALAFGFDVLGRPEEGCALIALTQGAFRVRKVKAKAIPVKQRLSIS